MARSGRSAQRHLDRSARAAPTGATAARFAASAIAGSLVHRRGAERQLLQSRLERGDQSRMTLANVVDAVAGQIHLLFVGDGLLQIPDARSEVRGSD
jgi:hypothetical protein